MIEDDQRKAIAQALGWRDFTWKLLAPPALYGVPPDLDYAVSVPRYTSDLNAMHGAEKTLTGSQLFLMDTHLLAMKKFEPKHPSFENLSIHATAAQRAEAFLRTLNLWIE